MTSLMLEYTAGVVTITIAVALVSLILTYHYVNETRIMFKG